MIYRNRLKRTFDFSIALIALALFGTPILLAMALVRLSSSGPVFFFQTRVGLRGQPFRIVKLRTMTVNPNRKINQTTNCDPEVFVVARILRRLKIDELPQLLNILKGDMSLVGPRPCLEQTRDEMPDWARRRFEVRPGITGLAQINGNIALTWEERWKYDVEYVEIYSFPLDLVTILKTVLIVIFGEERFKKPL